MVGADSRTYYSDFNKTLQFIKPNKDGLDFMVLPGDMEYVLVNKENYTDVELPGLQTYWVVGNHEMDVGDEVNISNLYPSLPNTLYYYDDSLRTTYIAEYDNLYIVVLDEYREYAHGNIPRNGPQFAWLEEHLALLDPAKKIFAFGHEPAYPEHAHVGDSLDQFPSDRDALWSMFDNNSVEAYFCGHTHWYSMNDSMLNVTQVDVGNMRWWGDGNSTLAYVAVNDTTATAYIYSNSTKGTVLDLIDTYDITNDYYTQDTIFVNTTGYWRAGESFHSDADPIGGAESIANSGDSIFIYGGDYSESITVLGVANLTFIGESSDVVNITGTGVIFDVRESYVNISGINLTVASGGTGIRLYDAQHCHLDDIKVSGGKWGIRLYGASYGSLKNSNITGCSEAGIELTFRATSNNNATWNLIDNCIVTNCVALKGRGIHLLGSANNTISSNTISNCTVTECYKSGLYLSTNADYNTIRDSVFNDSTNHYGIRTKTASHNNITGCIISNNSDGDIYLESSSDNTLTNNTLNGTTVSFTYSGDVSLKGVGFPANDLDGWHNISKFIRATNQGAGAWLYLNFSYSGDDVSGLNESSLAVWKHNASGWIKDGWSSAQYLNTTDNVVGANITTFSVFAPMASSAPPTFNCTCGDICVNETGWWRDGDDFNSSANPLSAAHSNATAGDTICVKDGTYNASLWIYKDNLTFRSENGTANCIVNATGAYAFATGNNYVNISGFTVENATATPWWSAGIIIQGNNCNVSYNIARGNFFGINIDGGDYNLVAHNNASYNSQDGIRPANAANNNEITGNTANYNINGIYLYIGCNNSEIRDNTANYNSQKGIALDYNCNYNNLTNNTANYNSHHSIFLYDSCSYNNLTGNNAFYNTEDGFHLELNSQHNTLKSNIAEHNNFSIYLYNSCCYNNLTDNIARFSSWRGIVLHNSCNYNNLTNNTASNNVHDGIHFQNSCNYNNLTNNTANSNGVDGIDIEDSNNNTLLNNTANTNTKDGINLYQSNNNTVRKNTVLENHQHGIQLEDGSNNNVSCNWVQNSNDHGFHVGGSSTGNTFKYNNIVTNGIFIETNGSYQWQFYNGLSEGINANYNYWGPNMTSEKINASIYDSGEDSSKGTVTYYPFNMSACPCAPIPEASTFFLFACGLTLVVLIRYFCERGVKKARK